MPVRVQDIVAALDRVAPFRLAYDWDNVGFQVGNPRQTVRGVAVGLEVNDEFLRFARRARCEMLVVHHPLIFGTLKRVTEDGRTGRLASEIIRAGMALAVAHTNLDRVPWGTNGVLADLVELADRKPLEPCPLEERCKFTVFVPTSHVEPVIEAIHRGGGGRIGNYSHCTFRAPGTGTYVPEAGAAPWQGEVGKFEEADEVRLEAVVPRWALGRVLREVLAVHPYEEVAWDVYPLVEAAPTAGLGVTGTLLRAATLAQLAKRLAESCRANGVSIAGDRRRPVRRVAIVSGSAGSSVDRLGPDEVDAVVTGELSYHKAAEAVERGIGVICLGHAASEKVVAAPLARLIQRELGETGKGLRWKVFDNYTDPCAAL
jgi:dinuclear metal center YbgI/SA1388 family protein